MDTARQKCLHCKAFTVLQIYIVIVSSGMLRSRISRYIQSTFGESRLPFPEVLQINCKTDCKLACRERLHQSDIPVRIFIDKANIKPWSCICCLSFRRFANIFPHYRKKLGSTYFTMVPHWNISNWPPLGNRNFKHTAGTKAWDDGLTLL